MNNTTSIMLKDGDLLLKCQKTQEWLKAGLSRYTPQKLSEIQFRADTGPISHHRKHKQHLQIMHMINHIVLRKAKNAFNVGLSEYNRVKLLLSKLARNHPLWTGHEPYKF